MDDYSENRTISQTEIYTRSYINRADDRKSPCTYLGAYASKVAEWACDLLPSDSLLAQEEGVSLDLWKMRAKEQANILLGRMPKNSIYNPKIMNKSEFDGLIIETIKYDLGYGYETEGLLLLPNNADKPLPGFLGLHDHGAFKFYGKEKIAGQPDDHVRPKLAEFRQMIYGGSTWANRLAKSGFAVFVHDVFPWGSRKIEINDLGEDVRRRFSNYEYGTSEYIAAYNIWASESESVISKALTTAGMTMMGIIAYEDRCALDYLASRTEVDSSRLGCGGLSGGGLRTIFLAGLDDRIQVAFCAGFMPTVQGIAYSYAFHHTSMAFLHGMAQKLDFADIISLHAPKPFFLIQCAKDNLFPLSAMKASNKIIKEVYRRFHAGEKYRCKFYNTGHQFDIKMQDEVFEWISSNL